MTWLGALAPRRWPLLLLPAALLFTGCDITPGLRTDAANTFAYNGYVAHRVGDLFINTFVWAVIVFVVVMGVFFFALWRFRARPDHPIPSQVHGNTKFELAWTIAPTLVLVIVTVPTIQTLFELENPPSTPLEVEVIGHQWWWEFHYPDQQLTTASDLHIPVGQPVRVSLRSNDVIHSFWVPRLAGKRDSFPVPDSTPWRKNHMWFNATDPGTYYGQCAEFCGLEHAQMRFYVVAQPAAEFQAWVQAQKQVPTGVTAEAGQAAFVRGGCIACHVNNTTDTQIPNAPVPVGQVRGPNLTHVGSRLSLAGGILENNDANLARWLRNPDEVKPGTRMKLPNPLSEDDIRDLVPYLRSLR